MTRWTPQQVAALAPDASSLAAARRLARPGPWSDTGSTDTLVWGKCQGSGKTPYQVSVDLTGPACLVLGGEGEGLRPLVARACDHRLTVPMTGRVGSLNVAAAAAVLCYEVVRQRARAPATRKPLDLPESDD